MVMVVTVVVVTVIMGMVKTEVTESDGECWRLSESIFSWLCLLGYAVRLDISWSYILSSMTECGASILRMRGYRLPEGDMILS